MLSHHDFICTQSAAPDLYIKKVKNTIVFALKKKMPDRDYSDMPKTV